MKWKFSLAGFLCIIAGAVIIPFVTPENPEQTLEPDKPEVVVVATNSLPSTNSLDRAVQQGLNWFKDSSNYIWDGWKIK